MLSKVFCLIFVIAVVSATPTIRTILAADQYQEAVTYVQSSNSIARIINDTIKVYKVTQSIAPG